MSEKTHTLKFMIAARHLWRRRTLILSGTALVTVLGLAYALLASPTYLVRAVIYPQDISANSDKGGLGGSLGGALNPLLGVSYLNRVETILKSRELARQVIVKNNLLPMLFPEDWDPKKKAFKAGADTSDGLYNGVDRLQTYISTEVDVYKMTLEVKIRAPGSRAAFRIMEAYLNGLNERMKENVIRNAEANREFLETQLERTMDPWAKEKIQQIIIRQIETTMLLNANGFEVLEAPEMPRARESPRRKRILALSVVLGFLGSCFAVLAVRALGNANAEMRLFQE